jgi:hypothetical protein
VVRYLKAAEADDLGTLVACFTEDASVLDEGRTYRRHAEIRRWRDEVAAKWTYTVSITGNVPTGDNSSRVCTHLSGDSQAVKQI